MIYDLNGTLEYNEDGEYILVNDENETNFSNILTQLYYSPTYAAGIKVMQKCKLLFDEEGNLYKGKVSPRLYNYAINGVDLEEILFDNVGKILNIVVDTEERIRIS